MRANAARQKSSLFLREFTPTCVHPVCRGESVGSPDRRSFCSGLVVPPLYVCRSLVRFVHREPLNLTVIPMSAESFTSAEHRVRTSHLSLRVLIPTLSSCRESCQFMAAIPVYTTVQYMCTTEEEVEDVVRRRVAPNVVPLYV